MELKVIAYARNGHSDKFGIPRQSREESPILTRIVFEPEFRIPEALRGIEGYSHLWLLWGFSEVQSDKEQGTKDWSPTVRPPRLGGNKRVGVFATRSPFRPNPIGLTSVKLIEVAYPRPLPKGKGDRLELIVSGADLMDGTPIYDIKPYLSYSDSHPDAQNGFAEETKDYQLKVRFEENILSSDKDIIREKPGSNKDEDPFFSKSLLQDIEYILRQDPRPAYQNDPTREYKMDYAGYTISFYVINQEVVVKKLQKCTN